MPQRDRDWFRGGVASLVGEMADDKTEPKAARKPHQVDSAHAVGGREDLKLADKAGNLRAIASSPPAEWSVQRRLDYVEWARQVAAGLRGVNPWLEEQFDEAAKRASQSVQPRV